MDEEQVRSEFPALREEDDILGALFSLCDWYTGATLGLQGDLLSFLNRCLLVGPYAHVPSLHLRSEVENAVHALEEGQSAQSIAEELIEKARRWEKVRPSPSQILAEYHLPEFHSASLRPKRGPRRSTRSECWCGLESMISVDRTFWQSRKRVFRVEFDWSPRFFL